MSKPAANGKRSCASWILGSILGAIPWAAVVAAIDVVSPKIELRIVFQAALVILVVASVSNFRRFGPFLVGGLIVGPVLVMGYGAIVVTLTALSSYGLKADHPPFR